MIKIALLELGGSHDECLYSQIKCLKSIPTIHLTLICDSKVAQNTIDFDKNIDAKIVLKVSKGILEWKQMYKLSNFLCAEKFYKIILNTAQSSHAKKLCFFLRQKIDVYGVLHNIKKLHGSIGQKIISKSVKGYFVLNDYLLEKIPKIDTPKFTSFYTIFFPKTSFIPLSKPSDEI
jgi:ADP-heptose:LPS heptosyltransferase